MNLGQLLAGQKGKLYAVANQNEKALREEKRVKIAEMKKHRTYSKPQKGVSEFVPPAAWKDATVIEGTK